jgi:hypothetical protein
VIEELVPEGLWERIQPLLPPPRPRRHCYLGRRPVGDRAALAGSVFVLKTGIRLEPAACRAGRLLRNHQLAAAARLDRGRRVACPARGPAGRAARPGRAGPGPLRRRRVSPPGAQRGDHVGPSPVDRARPGSKHHLICDPGGIPLAVTLTGGNRNDITQLIALIEAVPPIRGLRCRPREVLPTAATTTTPTAACCAPAASPGCTPSNACGSAASAAVTSTWATPAGLRTDLLPAAAGQYGMTSEKTLRN